MTISPPSPTGRVTLVSTDVEGSAALWRRAPDAMREALEIHDALLRRVLEAHRGYEARAVGDAFLFAWSSALDAVRFCVAVQRELLRADWPAGILEQPEAAAVLGKDGRTLWRGLRVRMGVHAGEPVSDEDPATGVRSYTGPAVRRASRLAGAAQGGQLLLTEAAWAEVHATLQDEVVTLDLGPHRFRGLSGTVRVVELRPVELSAREFAPMRNVDAEQTNALRDANALVGRDHDLNAVSELFGFGVRMVTLVGAPGSGRSRLARELVLRDLARWSGEDQGGAWVCGVTEDSADGVLQAVGTALDVPLTLGRSPEDSVVQLGHAIAARGPILLVIDGLERIPMAAREAIETWMRLAPTARFLVTAGDRLAVEGEVAYLLAPLDLPDDGHPASASAVRLLTRRLRERVEGVRLSSGQQRRCGGLLSLAGGLPLAIEMLAGQIAAHPIPELESDVAGRLENPVRASLEQRLQAVFDACLARLRPWERGALTRCSVFRDGFDLEAAEAVIDLSEWAGAPAVADAVERLRELGVLRAVDVPSAPGSRRFEMHPFVRDAVEAGFPPHDRAAAEDRHAEYFVRWGKPWADHVHRVDGSEALARLERERSNLVAAVRNMLALRPLTVARVDRALGAVLVLSPLLAARGPFATHLRLLDEVIDAAVGLDGVASRLVVRALRERGEARRLRGLWGEARADVERALSMAREIDYAEGEAVTLESFGQLLRLLGKPSDALAVLEQALDRSRVTRMRREEGLVLGNMGVVYLHLGDTDEALLCIRTAIERFREVGDRRREGVQVGNLGVIHRRLGNLERTRELYWQALDIHRETGDRRREGVMLGNLGVLHYHVGDLETAFDLYDQALSVAREVGDRLSEATALANIGLVYTEQSQYDDALGLYHQALALNRDVGERVGEGCDIGFLGALHHLQGDLDKARDHYRRALELLDRQVQRRYAGSFLSWAAACEADLGDAESSEEMFEAARECLEDAGDPHLLAARTVLRGALDLAEARARAEGGDHVAAARAREAARERMVEVRREVDLRGEPVSGDLRLAFKWLSDRLGDLA